MVGFELVGCFAIDDEDTTFTAGAEVPAGTVTACGGVTRGSGGVGATLAGATGRGGSLLGGAIGADAVAGGGIGFGGASVGRI